MPINSRAKGAAAERELASKLRTLFGVMARRGQQFSGGTDSPDIVFSDKIHIEAKRTERLNLSQAFAQSLRDSKYPDSGRVPSVFSRRSREDWLVTVRLDDIIEFSKAILSEVEKGKQSENATRSDAISFSSYSGIGDDELYSNPMLKE